MSHRHLDFRLYLIADLSLAGPLPLDRMVAAAVAGGVTMVQLRGKGTTGLAMHRIAQRLKAVLAPTGIPLIVNDDVALAQAVGADGVHLGEDDLPVAVARRILGAGAIIGTSAGTHAEAANVAVDHVDYVGVGPIYGTATKEDAGPAIGLDGFAAVRAALPLSAVGIGSINAGNAAAVIRQGAAGVAVASALCCVADPETMARTLRQVIAEARS